MVRYNENDPFAARWLRNLIASGCIADGEIDARDIQEVKPDDVREADQFHAFAGIGGWSLALRLANWPDHVGVWTGSCPCQPFSAAGKKEGFSDERHLWPEWFRLIQECRPPIIFGEQVASPDGVRWLDVVFSDLEGAGYACGAADLCAASVGAPHIRQRLFFVAYSTERGSGAHDGESRAGDQTQESVGRYGIHNGLADAGGDKRGTRRAGEANERSVEPTGCGDDERLAYAERPGREQGAEVFCGRQPEPASGGKLGHTISTGLEGRPRQPEDDGQELATSERAGNATRGFWSELEWLPCSDGNARPTQPSLFPLADGVPGRVGRLRAYGNAIIPQVAAVFVRAFMEIYNA